MKVQRVKVETTTFTKIIAFFCILIGLGMCAEMIQESSETRSEATAKAFGDNVEYGTRAESSKEIQFHPWDGSHIKLERLIKANLNDPDSYQHIKTFSYPNMHPPRVKLAYRAKNGFGGMVIGYVLAEVTDNGDVLSIIEQG